MMTTNEKNDSLVDEAIDESFPASDPPSYNMGSEPPPETRYAQPVGDPPRWQRLAHTGALGLAAALDVAAKSLERLRQSLIQRVPPAGSTRPGNAPQASG